MEGRVYTVTMAAVTLTACTGTIIQIATPATIGIELVRAWVGQSSVTTSTQQNVLIRRSTAAATVTSATPTPVNKNDPASLCVGGAALTGTLGTAEGTTLTTVYADAFSLLNGWLWVPTPTDRITVNISQFIALVLPSVSTTLVCSAGIAFKELT